MVNGEVGVAVIGAGFGGLGMSIALQRQGIDHVVFERDEDVGGTWWANTYPGCQCDVPSNLYSFSFALNPDWSSTYPLQPEIQAYLRRCAQRFGVLDRIRFGHEVLAAAWEEDARRWRIETSKGTWTADILIAAPGPLAEPSMPEIPGLADFRGTIFHSAEWRHDHDLAGERVAVIGTGASAIQLVPRIQPEVGRLLLFQRTPGWVVPHRARPTTPFERSLYRRLPFVQRLARYATYWSRELLILGFCKNPRWMEPVRRIAVRHLERQVHDPELRRKLTPSFLPGCKRLMPSNDYYPALNHDNVEVITDRISEIRPHAVETADGAEHPVDTIIAATGFHVTDNPVFEKIRGRGGRSLADTWRDSGSQAYLGTTVAGFPNLFLLAGPNTGIGHTSLVVMIESQIRYVLDALRTLARRKMGAFEVRPEAQKAFNDEVQRRMRTTVWNTGGCKSWYLDEEGRNTTLWPDFTWRYRLRTRRFDAGAYLFLHRSVARREQVTVIADDGTRLAAEVTGDTEAPVTVVLAHGWALSSRSWEAVARTLSDSARIVSYDQRGHGRSGWRDGSAPTIDDLGEDLRAVLEQAAPHGRLVLAGHSMGGMTIMAFAAAHPDLVARRVGGVALVDTSAGALRGGSYGLPDPLALGVRRFLALFMAAWVRWPRLAERTRRLASKRRAIAGGKAFLFGPNASLDMVTAAMDVIAGTPANVIGAFHAALMGHDKQDALASLRDVPVLIMVGDGDRLTPPEHSRRLAQALPDARLVVVPDTGHMLPMEKPELVAGHIRELVEEGAGAGTAKTSSTEMRSAS
jgi:cation diffusion facilitator CzcD-associated flavoprotein CzcO/pimeloyl-ACP methyl ester carboxylesterase